MTPPPPPLPVPSFLDRAPGSDPEAHAWVVTAQETVAALDAELLAARARAKTAERRLTELGPRASTLRLATGTRTVDEQAELGSRVAETQARFEAATEAAAKVMAEARAVLQEARYGSTPQGLMAPGVSAQPGASTEHSLTAPGAPTPTPTGTPRGSADSSAQALWAPGRSEPFAPAPAGSPRPPAPAPGTPAPAAASPSEPRAGAADRYIAARPAHLGYDPSVVLPPRAPSRASRPGLGRLFGRSARRP